MTLITLALAISILGLNGEIIVQIRSTWNVDVGLLGSISISHKAKSGGLDLYRSVSFGAGRGALSSLDCLDDVDLIIGFGLVRVAGVLDRDLKISVGGGNVHLHGGKVVCGVGGCLVMVDAR